MQQFIIDCYTADTYNKLYGFPENSYGFDTKIEAIKCLTDLINNDISGIYHCELKINKFNKDLNKDLNKGNK